MLLTKAGAQSDVDAKADLVVTSLDTVDLDRLSDGVLVVREA